jgi:hypothetical protein
VAIEIDIRTGVNQDGLRIRVSDTLYITGAKGDDRLSLYRDGTPTPLMQLAKANVENLRDALALALRIW